MVKLTASLEKWLWDNDRQALALIRFGHTEMLTDEMKEQYLSWCETEEGKSYLEGGKNYHEPR